SKRITFRHLHNTFGALCAVQSVSNIGILLIFLLWCAIGSRIFDEDTLIGEPGKRIGHIALLFQNAKMYAHLGVSINRLFAILFPFKYSGVSCPIM
ncbi:hypothetical protein PMAYCL1PPCAC_16959, partial [Pristionchus mayeri]